MTRQPPEHEELLTPGEAAWRFRVHPKTLSNWEHAGLISSIRTPGGARRYREAEVDALMAATVEPRAEQP